MVYILDDHAIRRATTREGATIHKDALVGDVSCIEVKVECVDGRYARIVEVHCI